MQSRLQTVERDRDHYHELLIAAEASADRMLTQAMLPQGTRPEAKVEEVKLEEINVEGAKDEVKVEEQSPHVVAPAVSFQTSPRCWC